MTTLVLVHGWAASSRIWERQREHFGASLELRTPDLPAWEADWLEDYLRPLALDQTVLVGWSLGGMLAVEALARLASAVRHLVLVGVAASFCRRPDFAEGVAPALVRARRRQLWSDPPQVIQEFAQLCLAPGEQNFGQDCLSLWPPSGVPEFLASGLDYLLAQDLRPYLGRVTGNITIVHGDADRITPVAQAYYLKEQIPGARLEIYQDTGHLPFLTRAAKFNALLMELVDES
ncbi:MAG: alpha/beta fold hydrolase [Desulfobacca sp.]|nr:alpha/beta fold hydrolase [Desulfobacca sp.]